MHGLYSELKPSHRQRQIEKMILLVWIFLTGLLTSQASTDLKNLAQANNDFSIKLYKSFPSTGNTFYSPASIFIALGMLYKGAGGNTAQEMRTALSYDTAQLTDESVHQKFKNLLDLFENSSDKYKLQIANAIVTSSGYQISEDYKEALKTYYKAITKEVNFGSENKAALDDINNWVSEKTQGKIPKLLEELDKDTVMVLLNAVYFKGTWKTQFNESFTRDGEFYANGKDAKQVKMMNTKSKFQYDNFPEDKFHALKLPYKGEEVSMVIVLPFERNGLKDLEDILTLQKLQEIASSVNGGERRIKVSIPKFKLEDSKELVENLKQLGMRDAFANGVADFSGIDKSRRMLISEVVHKAVIEVNEEGSEAAAATAVIGVVRSGPRRELEFIANHPFLFFIKDERTEMILFMGRVNEL
uniref:Putative Protease inhibitor n=1 Tax=Megacormus gertschi TaxID=1843536 RepID=A0A224X3U8_9SCOR